MNSPASRAGRMGSDHLPSTGTSMGGSATAAATLAPPAPRVVRRLAGLPADAAELERRLRLELDAAAAAALRVDMAGLAGGETTQAVYSQQYVGGTNAGTSTEQGF